MARLCAALVAVCLLGSGHLRADAQVSEWIGEYAMSHDGLQGTLRVNDSRRDCAAPAWCHLVLSYVDAKGVRLPATIVVVDQMFQHMAFVITFAGNRQRFDGYLMSWDKNRIAGTTVWQGRTFGFYAFKSTPVRILQPTGRGAFERPGDLRVAETPAPAPATPPGTSGSVKTIAADGSVQTTLADGRKRVTRPGVCGSTIINPDGTVRTIMCAQVQPATPPLPDQASELWLNGHSTSLLDIIRSLVGNDQASVDNYLRNFESPQSTVYDRIFLRTDLIAKLSEPS